MDGRSTTPILFDDLFDKPTTITIHKPCTSSNGGDVLLHAVAQKDASGQCLCRSHRRYATGRQSSTWHRRSGPAEIVLDRPRKTAPDLLSKIWSSVYERILTAKWLERIPLFEEATQCRADHGQAVSGRRRIRQGSESARCVPADGGKRADLLQVEDEVWRDGPADG